jgi:hypothetical protein
MPGYWLRRSALQVRGRTEGNEIQVACHHSPEARNPSGCGEQVIGTQGVPQLIYYIYTLVKFTHIDKLLHPMLHLPSAWVLTLPSIFLYIAHTQGLKLLSFTKRFTGYNAWFDVRESKVQMSEAIQQILVSMLHGHSI